MFKLQPKLAKRQLKVEKEDIMGEFTMKRWSNMYTSFMCNKENAYNIEYRNTV